MDISSATEVNYVSGVEYLIIAEGGNLDVERYEAGNYVEVSGSPVLDGQSRRLLTITENGKIRLTPSASMTYQYAKVEKV